MAAKNPRAKSLTTLFYQGNYRLVVDSSVDSKQGKCELEDVPVVVGALSFLGRATEAERLYRKEEKKLSLGQKVEGRFFLGVSFARHSQLGKAREFFGANLRLLKKLDDKAAFYAHQGVGFYRLVLGQLRKSFAAGDRAYAHAASAGFVFGKVFASDLKGHALIQLGKIGQGIESMRYAAELAKKLNNPDLSAIIFHQVMIHECRYGLMRGKEIETLNRELKTLVEQDTYTKTSLLIELSRQYILRGLFQPAKEILNEAIKVVYAKEHRRHELLVNALYAWLSSLQGDDAMALSFVQNAKRQLDKKADRLVEVKLLGLESELCERMGLSFTHFSKLKTLTVETSQYQAIRTLARVDSPDTTVEKGNDPMGDIFDEVARQGDASVPMILKSQYLSLLYRCLPVKRGENCLYLDLVPGSLTRFSKDGIAHAAEGVSKQVRLVLRELTRGEKSKEALIKAVWGYTYHPLRHDPLIYTAVGKIRRLLGEHSDWLQATDSGYRLAPSVRVIFHQAEVVAERAEISEPVFRAIEHQLNARQLRILQEIDQTQMVDLKICKGLLKTSRISACRDLSDLTAKGLLVRLGKGRATKYIRAS